MKKYKPFVITINEQVLGVVWETGRFEGWWRVFGATDYWIDENDKLHILWDPCGGVDGE